ncbi:DUF86 domain-containing protein [Rhizobium sp. LCM 4573]|uniref:HepT-like ribonuclease domain-containing protein n=1 Tax=Rhizobium sp. LCM 4573 TaxID=1848291 RepID=UPI0008D963E8|nr:HepT-like ribonuclease domain-containing protein [Rhizobium sp. LCM 4573]OHV75965.1 hypothetical protein LCM4573_15030 [Rhizobium sp. LCM 4573]
MARDATPALADILEAIELIEKALANKSRDEFQQDQILKLAIQRAIEIISEASKHIPSELLQHAPEIPWRSIRAIGNILRHEYHHIADDVIWDLTQHDLPPLKAAVLTLQKITLNK